MDTSKDKKDMERNELLQILNMQLPRGYRRIIAQRLGISVTAVSNFLTGRTKNIRIENEVLDVLAELNHERKQKLVKAGLL